MEFIRKNWSRLSLALLFLLGGILGIVAFANSGIFSELSWARASWQEKLFNIVLLATMLVYFFGMVCVTVLKCVAGKKAVSIAYIVLGGLVSVANIVVLCICANQPDLISLVSGDAIAVFYQFMAPTILFGLYPLIKGVTRFIEAEQTPAPVKPAVQPAVATEAPAPKAAATKATPAKKTTKASAK